MRNRGDGVLRRAARKFAWIFLLCLLPVVQFSGCAVIDRDRRHVAKIVEEAVPESMPLMLLTLPAWGVAGLVAIAVDGLVLNPVLSAPAALDDATLAFTFFGWLGPLEIILLPVRVVAAVPIFLGSEILRIMIPYVF